MKFDTKEVRVKLENEGWCLVAKIPNNLVDKVEKLTDKEGVKSVEIKQKRKSRSLNANAYFWTICNKIAIILGSTDEEVYERMLCDYGTKEYVVAVPEARPILLKAYKIVEVVSSVKIKNKQGTQFRLIRGSSTYDTKEMSVLINGVVQEAKALNIETLTPNEIESMMVSYEGS